VVAEHFGPNCSGSNGSSILRGSGSGATRHRQHHPPPRHAAVIDPSFELGRLSFFRSAEYLRFFARLDHGPAAPPAHGHQPGHRCRRWESCGAVRTLAVEMLLPAAASLQLGSAELSAQYMQADEEHRDWVRGPLFWTEISLCNACPGHHERVRGTRAPPPPGLWRPVPVAAAVHAEPAQPSRARSWLRAPRRGGPPRGGGGAEAGAGQGAAAGVEPGGGRAHRGRAQRSGRAEEDQDKDSAAATALAWWVSEGYQVIGRPGRQRMFQLALPLHCYIQGGRAADTIISQHCLNPHTTQLGISA
jgi:hypothetical protein